MRFISDPAIATKIQKMRQRVRWQDPLILKKEVDQTRLVLDDQWDEEADPLSFLVIGDTGVSRYRSYNPQRRVSEQMSAQHDCCRFILHTGDVVYLVGSSEFYPKNFIKPYSHFLVNGQHPDQIAYDQMIFSLPFLPVPGNHDYYDLPFLYGFFSGLTLPLRRLFLKMDFDVGWHGSYQGRAYARAFLDCLNRLGGWGELERHLDRHYTAQTETGQCLRYQPGEFTRLPNRYYMFRSHGIDFFALDSNTFNAPMPLPETQAGEAYRRQLEQQRVELERRRQQLLEESMNLNSTDSDEAERLDDCYSKIEQIGETIVDIDKQLESHDPPVVDFEQLDWLKQRLIDSWNNPEVRGRVLFFHHPPYVTEASKWNQAQTLTIRRHLRRVLDEVAAEIGSLPPGRSLVDLVLNGHAHCLEHLSTLETGHADAHIDWIVCGGSGYSLRRQRREGSDLKEILMEGHNSEERLVARSHLYLGRAGHGSQKRRPYSFLKIEVSRDRIPQFKVRPFISERIRGEWHDYALEPFTLSSSIYAD